MDKACTKARMESALLASWNWLLGLRMSEQTFAKNMLAAMPRNVQVARIWQRQLNMHGLHVHATHWIKWHHGTFPSGKRGYPMNWKHIQNILTFWAWEVLPRSKQKDMQSCNCISTQCPVSPSRIACKFRTHLLNTLLQSWWKVQLTKGPQKRVCYFRRLS